MGFWVSFELEVPLRGRTLVVKVHDHYVQDGEMDEEDELVFVYQLFDPEEEAEITQITTEEHDIIYKAIIADFASICCEDE